MRMFLTTFYLIVITAQFTNAQVPSENESKSRLKTNQTVIDRQLNYPDLVAGVPIAGKRVAVIAPEYRGTKVHHILYLPVDWNDEEKANGKKWPVIVEYTGNKYDPSGSTGEVEGGRLGYGISGGRCIWIVLPFVEKDRQSNALNWWGDTEATVDYAKTNVPRICEAYGGDPDRVLLCGFSRGAIAASYIGLHDDQIAKMWSGLITHDHFDGVLEWQGTEWGSPLEIYQKEATERLQRLNGRPLLVCQERSVRPIKKFLESRVDSNSVTYIEVNVKSILGDFPNEFAIHPHNDRWLVKDSAERRQVWAWVEDALKD